MKLNIGHRSVPLHRSRSQYSGEYLKKAALAIRNIYNTETFMFSRLCVTSYLKKLKNRSAHLGYTKRGWGEGALLPAEKRHRDEFAQN